MKKNVPPPEPIQGGPEEIFQITTFGIGAHFGNDYNKLPAKELHQINTLRRFYAYRHNGYLLVEALGICTRHSVNPPVWVLTGMNEGFQTFNKGYVTLERALHMGARDREEYHQYRQQQPVMAKLRKRIDRYPEKHLKIALDHIANRNNIDVMVLEKQYNRMWRRFFDYLEGR